MILIGAMIITVVISGYFLMVRLLYGTHSICYDAWIFGTNIALLLQVYDNHHAVHAK